jgi:hypothetical protein
LKAPLIPKYIIIKGIKANGGVTLKRFIMGSDNPFTVLYQPIRKPNGTATLNAILKPERTLKRLALIF